MKTNNINCSIGSEGITRLRGFKNSNISVFSEILNGETVAIKLQHEDTVFFITNEPVKQMDSDEYPVLSINTDLNFSFTDNFTLNAKLLSMSLIRDKLSWERNGVKWAVEIDIGIKVVTDKKEIAFIAKDSIVGLMVFIYGDNIKIPNSESDLKDQWVYKADEFISLCREQIPIL
jgi:hypothetical protein